MDYPHKTRGRACVPLPSSNPNGAVVYDSTPYPYLQSHNHHPRSSRSVLSNAVSHYKESFATPHQPMGTSAIEWTSPPRVKETASPVYDIKTNKPTPADYSPSPDPPRHRTRQTKPPAPPVNDSQRAQQSHFYSPPHDKIPPSPPPTPQFSRREVGLVSPQRGKSDARDNRHNSLQEIRKQQQQQQPKIIVTRSKAALPPINKVAQSATHTHTSGGTQNTGNSIGTKSTIRQSKYFRMYESGNQTKAILGQDNLCWDVNKKQGAYSGNVFNAAVNDTSGGSTSRRHNSNQVLDNNYNNCNKNCNNVDGEGTSKYFTDKHRSRRYQQSGDLHSANRGNAVFPSARQNHDMWSTTSRASY